MSKAEELLNSLAEAYKAESNGNSEPHIVIGVDRFITVPDELKRIAVQYDHNIRTVTFDCPRYYDGRDMSKMQVYINVMLPDGKPTSHYVGGSNLSVDNSDPNVMHFHWTITSNITRVKGNLMFLVCIRKADEEGNEINHWNSELNKDLYVSEGLEFSSQMIEDKYPDIVTQLLQRMDAVEALANPEAMQGYANTWLDENSDAILANIQNKGNEVLNSIPEEYTETHNYANEGARTKADAITRIVDGDVISVNDSSDDYVRGLRVFGKTTQFTTTGKNLLQLKSKLWNVDNRGTLHVEFNTDGSVHVTGMNVQSGTIYAHSTVTASYVMLFANVEYIFNGPGDNIEWELVDDNYTTLCASQGEAVRYTSPTDIKARLRITVYADIDYDAVFYPMVRLASIEDDTWEPYTGGMPSPNPDYPQDLVSVENPTVKVIGANLVPFLKEGSVYKGQGLTLEVYGDRCVCSGVPERVYASVANATITLPKGIYTVSGGKMEDGAMYLQVRVVRNGVASHYFGGDSFTIYGDETTIAVTVQVGNTTAEVVNYTFYPILNVGNSIVDYEPYIVGPALVIPHVLRGIPVSSGGNYTDVNGQQWVGDEVDFERGVYVQRIAHYIFDGSEDEAWSGIYNYGEKDIDYVNIHLVRSRDLYSTPLICNRMVRRTWNEEFTCFINEYDRFVVGGSYYDGRMSNLETFKSYLSMNPLELVYVLETPIEIALSAEELNAFRAIRTNYPNTTVINDSNVKMELRYNADTETYIDNAIRDTAFVVNIEISDQGYGTDKTSAEIYEAWSNNRRIVYKTNLLSGESEGIPLMFSAEVCMFMTFVTMSGMGSLVMCTITGSTLTVEGMD